MHPLPAVIQASRRQGLNALAITDHNVILSHPLEISHSGVRLIPGEEVETTEGEIIGLFLRRLVPPGLSPEETIGAIKEQGGVTYLPHPLKRTGSKRWSTKTLERILPGIDVIEVFNGRLLDAAANREAARLAKEAGVLPGAGSDAHTAWELGRVFVEMDDFDSPASFLASLRRGRIIGRPPSVLTRTLLNRWVRRGLRLIHLAQKSAGQWK